MQNNNPYASPVDVNKGEWDHSLFRRILKVCGYIAAWFLVMDLIVLAKFFRYNEGQIAGTSFVEMVKAFFIDWNI